MSNKKIIVPPIKIQGIKTKLVPWIKEIMPPLYNIWVEPFLGSGVVAFNCAKDAAILNDANPHIINFYKQIQNDTITGPVAKQYLEEADFLLKNSGKEGYDYFNIVKNRFNKKFEPLDFLFLSRAGFNGMMRFNKKGLWNIPFCKKPNRFAQSYTTKIVNQIKNVSQIITTDWSFYNKNFIEIIAMAKEDDLIYCDPPYFGRYADYYNGWTEEDERDLFESLCYTKAKFILSTWHHNQYRKNEMIDKYWNKFNILTTDHFYHSGGKIENRQPIVEAIVLNYDPKTNYNHKVKNAPKRVLQTAMF